MSIIPWLYHSNKEANMKRLIFILLLLSSCAPYPVRQEIKYLKLARDHRPIDSLNYYYWKKAQYYRNLY